MAENQPGSSNAAHNVARQTQKPVPPTNAVMNPPLPSLNARNPEADDTQNSSTEKPLARWKRPEWVIVYVTVLYAIAAFLTLLVLRRQGNHTITSERAWFVCRAFVQWERGESEEETARICFTYENVGKTLGFITEIGFAVTGLKKDQKLPELVQDYQSDDTIQWTGGRGLPIVPGDNMGRRAAWTSTGAQLDEWRRGELVIWVHGYVKYRDSFVRREHETRYCLKWEPSKANSGTVEFSIDGPPAYNSAT